jgi:hypothetical protein
LAYNTSIYSEQQQYENIAEFHENSTYIEEEKQKPRVKSITVLIKRDMAVEPGNYSGLQISRQ